MSDGRFNAADPAPPDEAGLIPNCPRCAYSLRGLPVEHRCPECGFSVNRCWRVFGGRPTAARKLAYLRQIRILLWCVLCVLVPACGLALYAFYRRGDAQSLMMSLTLASLIFALLFRRPKKFLALDDECLHVHHGGDAWEHIPWTRLSRAFHVPGTRTLTLVVDGRNRDLSTRDLFGLDVFEIDIAVSAINARSRLHSAEGCQTSERASPQMRVTTVDG